MSCLPDKHKLVDANEEEDTYANGSKTKRGDGSEKGEAWEGFFCGFSIVFLLA